MSPPQSDEEAIVTCGTTKGEIVLRLVREWSPHGYDRAKALFQAGYYDYSHFFRVLPHFLVQFGIGYTDDADLKHLANSPIPDDPVHDPPIHFGPGTISYAGSGKNSRTSQLFISYGSAPSLGKEVWETPIGGVMSGMEAAESFYSYGDGAPWGKGPVQQKIHQGRDYIDEEFPLLDSFTTCSVRIVPFVAAAAEAAAAAGADEMAELQNDEEDEEEEDDDDQALMEVHRELDKSDLTSARQAILGEGGAALSTNKMQQAREQGAALLRKAAKAAHYNPEEALLEGENAMLTVGAFLSFLVVLVLLVRFFMGSPKKISDKTK